MYHHSSSVLLSIPNGTPSRFARRSKSQQETSCSLLNPMSAAHASYRSSSHTDTSDRMHTLSEGLSYLEYCPLLSSMSDDDSRSGERISEAPMCTGETHDRKYVCTALATIFPAYMTTIQSATSATTPRSCVIKTTDICSFF